MSIDPMSVWANMQLKIWPERYWMLELGDASASDASSVFVECDDRYCCLIRDQAGVSAIVEEKAFERLKSVVKVRECFGPFRVVSTDGDLPFDVIGFLRPVLELLNNCRVPDDQMSYRSYPLLAARELLKQFIREQVHGHQAA